MNKGGTLSQGGVQVTMTQAVHSSTAEEGGQLIPAGDPAGFIVAFANGFVAYHAGDTAVFKDMELIRELYHPQVAMLPIGSHYVMSPAEAALACRLLQPEFVIPMHYGTFPVLTGTPQELEAHLKRSTAHQGPGPATRGSGGIADQRRAKKGIERKVTASEFLKERK